MESKKIAEEIKQELVKCFVSSENRNARKNFEDKQKILNQQVKKSFLAVSDIIREDAKIRGNDVEFNKVLRVLEKEFVNAKGNIEKKVLENINQRENELNIKDLSTNLCLEVATKITETLDDENMTLESISDVADSVNKTVEKVSQKRENIGEKYSEKMEAQIDDLIKTELKTKIRRIMSTSNISSRVDIYKLESDIGKTLEGKFVTPLKEEFKQTDKQNIENMKTDEKMLGKIVSAKLEKIVKGEIEQNKNEKANIEQSNLKEKKVEELNADFLDELKENVNTFEEVVQKKSCIEEEKELTKDKGRYSLPGDVII